MYAVTSTWVVSFTRATFRSAEFGFFGVVVYTRVHTPRRCGLPLRAAVLTLAILSRRPLRTSWLMVGMYRLSVLLLLVFGCSQVCVLRVSLVRVPRDRACRTRPRTDVSSMHRGHANWPGVQAYLRNHSAASASARHDGPRYPPTVGQVKARQTSPFGRPLSASPCRTPGAAPCR